MQLAGVNEENVEHATVSEAVSVIRSVLKAPDQPPLELRFRGKPTWHRGGDLLLSRNDGFYPSVYFTSPSMPVDNEDDEVLSDPTTHADAAYFPDDEEDDLTPDEVVQDSLQELTELFSQDPQLLYQRFLEKLKERDVEVSDTRAKAAFDTYLAAQNIRPPWLSSSSFSRSLSDLGLIGSVDDPSDGVTQLLLATGNGKYWVVVEKRMLRWAHDMFSRRLRDRRRGDRSNSVHQTQFNESFFVWDNLSLEISEINGATPMAVASHLSGSPHPIFVRFSVSSVGTAAASSFNIDMEVSVCVLRVSSETESRTNSEADTGSSGRNPTSAIYRR